MTIQSRPSTLPQKTSSAATEAVEPLLAVNLDQSSTDRTDLALPSTLASVDRLEQQAEAFATGHGFNEDDAANIAMAVREATVNAVLHGNSYSSDKQVTASFAVDEKALTIRIQDQGTGFNANVLPDPLSPENILRSSGRGVFLMRALMDEVHFRQLAPGTELTLIKYRATDSTPA